MGDRIILEESFSFEELEPGTEIVRPGMWMITKMTDGPDDPEPLWAIWEPREAIAMALGMVPAKASALESAEDAHRFVALNYVTDRDVPADTPAGGHVLYLQDVVVGGPIFLDASGREMSVTPGDLPEPPAGEM